MVISYNNKMVSMYKQMCHYNSIECVLFIKRNISSVVCNC